jgi:peroxiredoxin
MAVFRHLVIIAAVFILLLSTAYGAKLKEGEPPPTFTLINENGKTVNIDDLLVKPTVIYFTHNACHYCTQIIAMLKRAEKKFGNRDLQIMGVNVMAKDQKLVKAYKEELDFIFPMFAGNRSDVLKAYKIYYVPKLIFVDRNKIVRQIVGHYIHQPELNKYIKEIMGNP